MPNAVYGKLGTPKVWSDSGGDYAWDTQNLATVAAALGARGDFGAWPGPIAFRYYAEIEFASAPVADAVVELYLAGWDDDTTPGRPQAQVPATKTSYAAASAGLSKRKNMTWLRPIIAETSAVGPFSIAGVVNLSFRYVSPFIYNAATVGLKNTINVNRLWLTPIYAEIQ